MTQQYEYKSIRVPKSTLPGKKYARKREKILNGYAAQGWEVDQWNRIGFNIGSKDTVILKRKLSDRPEPEQPKQVQEVPTWGELGRELKAMWKRK